MKTFIEQNVNKLSRQKYFSTTTELSEKEKEAILESFGSSLGEKLYNYVKGSKENPTCVCGAPVKFKSFKIGYQSFCSKSCSAKHQKRSRESIEKAKKTYKKTMLEKYGVENYWQTEESKNLKRDFSNRPKRSKQAEEAALKKRQETNLRKYGHTCSLYGKNAEKVKKILEEKYGKNGVQKRASQVASQKRWNKHFESLVAHCERENLTILDHSSKNAKNFYRCNTCNLTFHRINGYPFCPECNKSSQFVSKKEKEIANYIRSFYKGEVRENYRQLFAGTNKEVDIWLPELNLAIEYDGTFWHSYNRFTDMSFSEFSKAAEWKRLECEKMGVRLITINECDYLDRPEVFQAFLKNVILPRKRIHGRKTIVKEIDTQTAREFCEKHHLNGFRGGSTKLGLFLEEQLLAVAVFAKHPVHQFECTRLAFASGVEVIGGWAKLQAHFGKPFLHYVNLNYFPGKNVTGCGYRFVLPDGRVLARNPQGLKKYCKTYDERISDFANCINNGFLCIPDLGNDKRLYNQKRTNLYENFKKP